MTTWKLECDVLLAIETMPSSPPTDSAFVVSRMEKILVVAPTYNEARKVDVVIVDDNSPDGTADVVRKLSQFGRRLFLLENETRRGFAQACKDGFCWAMENGYDLCIEMDADLSHDPADVPRLIAMIEEGADIAVGSRYLNGVRIINWPARRLLLSLFAGSYTRFWTGLPMTDPTSGFKAIRNKVLRSTDWSRFAADGYGFIIELHFLAWRNGFRIRECPIVFTERRRGASKMSKRIALESALSVLKLACQRASTPAQAGLQPVATSGTV
jgi:dolichol-phosphate mannosyltransferase